MNSDQKAQYRKLRLAQQLLDQHPDELAEVNGSPARAEFDYCVDAIEEKALDYARSHDLKKGLTKELTILRKELREGFLVHLVTLVQVNKHKLPVLQDYKLPSASAPDNDLISAGTIWLQHFAKYRKTFHAQHFRKDFEGQLDAAVKALRRAGNQRDRSQIRMQAATLGIPLALKRAWELGRVIHKLIVQHTPNASLSAQWKQITTHAARLAKPKELKQLPAPQKRLKNPNDDGPRRLLPPKS